MQQGLTMTPVVFFYHKPWICPRSLEMRICGTDTRQASDRYSNNGLISVSACTIEWEHGAGEVGGLKGGEWWGRGAGDREYVMHSALLASQPASQPASGTLMTIMSCHTGCRASQQILPLSLPFSNQCYWSVPRVKGQEHFNWGRVADIVGREGRTPDRSMTPPFCHWSVMIIHLPLTDRIREYVCLGRNIAKGFYTSITEILWVGEWQ